MAKPLATRTLRRRFERWIVTNGGTVLPLHRHEWARFRARGKLCIVYHRGDMVGAKVGPDVDEIWTAFEARQSLDLSPPAEGSGRLELAGRKAVALAMADVRAGRCEPLSIRALCRSTGLSVRTVARVARANGGRVRGMTLARAVR